MQKISDGVDLFLFFLLKHAKFALYDVTKGLHSSLSRSEHTLRQLREGVIY